jgi:CubicO group peptidase (beta-lactamase class C family)
MRNLIGFLVITMFTQCLSQKELLTFQEVNNLPLSTQLSIGYYDNGKITFAGYIKEDSTLLKKVKNKDNIFEIGSISKVFTSLLFVKFITEDKLNLNDSVHQFFDFELKNSNPEYPANEVLLKHLSNHTSGLPRMPIELMMDKGLDISNPYGNYSSKDLEEHLKTNFYRGSKSGEKEAYSNLGAALLGYVLEKQSGKSYEELLQEYIFNELDMNSSSNYIKDTSLLVKGRNLEGEVPNWDFDVLAGAGGIKSTVNDMIKFVEYNIETRDEAYLLMRDSTFEVNERMNMGLGWHIIKKDDKEYLFHNGGTGGYSSSLITDVANKKGVVIFCNMSATVTMGEIDKIAFDIIGNK